MTTSGRAATMLIADVNVFIGAHRADDPFHERMSGWLDDRLHGAEPFGVSELVLSAFVRIATNHRFYAPKATPEEALDFCAAVREAPASSVVTPRLRHWQIFDGLVRTLHATANIVPDAYLAALAIENDATLVSHDRGFRRFPGLRLLDPLAA